MPVQSTSSTSGSSAAVIGGSLGGLTAAVLLRDIGWEVTVFERSPVPLNGSGAGLVVHDATVRYLVECCDLGIEEISCGSSSIRTFGPDGTVVHEEPSQHRFTAWSTVYRALLRAFGADHYVLNETLVDLGQTGDSMEVSFASGRIEHADLVVCADGISSTARGILAGIIEPGYSGYVGWRGLVGESDLSRETFEQLHDSITYNVIEASHIVAYPIPNSDGGLNPGERLVNYVWYRNVPDDGQLEDLMTGRDGRARPISLQPGNVQRHHVKAMQQDAMELLAAPLAEMVELTADPFLQVIVDLESPRMAYGRIALIGDGAFAARPHAGAGTAKAADDGWQLAACLEAAQGDVLSALPRWEESQLALGRQLVRRSRAIGERSQFTNTWIPGDPDLRFGLRGPGR